MTVVGERTFSLTREELDDRARSMIRQEELTLGMKERDSRVHANVRVVERDEVTVYELTVRRASRDDENEDKGGHVIIVDPWDLLNEHLDAEMRTVIASKVGEALRPWRRERAWKDAGEKRMPHWAYVMHPVHRALLRGWIPDADMLHPDRPGPHRHIVRGLTQEHGDSPHQRRDATIAHVDGVIFVEKAALVHGGTPIEIGTTRDQYWIRLLHDLPDVVRTALVGMPFGRLVETGDPEADATTITGVVSGTRGARIILDPVYRPLTVAPAGIDTSWQPTRHDDVAAPLADLGYPKNTYDPAIYRVDGQGPVHRSGTHPQSNQPEGHLR